MIFMETFRKHGKDKKKFGKKFRKGFGQKKFGENKLGGNNKFGEKKFGNSRKFGKRPESMAPGKGAPAGLGLAVPAGEAIGAGIEAADVRRLIGLASKIQDLFRNKDIRGLKKTYQELVNDLVVDFDSYTYKFAAITHMLSKLLTKPRMWKRKGITGYMKKIDTSISEFIFFAKKSDFARMGESLDKASQDISSLDQFDQRYVNNLIDNTYLKIASTIYAKGASLGVASEVTGIPKQRIMEYIGKTTMVDRFKSGIEMRKRLSWVEDLLK